MPDGGGGARSLDDAVWRFSDGAAMHGRRRYMQCRTYWHCWSPRLDRLASSMTVTVLGDYSNSDMAAIKATREDTPTVILL